jgi:FkbM family methyltransferase
MTHLIQSLKDQFAAGKLGKPEFIEQALQVHSHLFDYVGITQRTDVREIRIAEDGVRFRIGEDDIWLYAPPGEGRVAPIEVMNFDHYEPEETRVMDLLSEGAAQILDIGANIGWYAARFAKRQPSSRIYAFEPLPVTYAYLQRNIAINGIADRVSSYNYGLSDACGSFDFFIAPASGTNASLLNVAAATDVRKVVGLTLTLDQWCSNQQVQPDYIKCDVEGAELLVFRGGRQTLSEHRPVVFAELLRKWSKPFGYHPNDMLAYFNELGYECFAVGQSGVRHIDAVTDETRETNYAFIHRVKHTELARKLQAL